jgi:hypothetical protein
MVASDEPTRAMDAGISRTAAIRLSRNREWFRRAFRSGSLTFFCGKTRPIQLTHSAESQKPRRFAFTPFLATTYGDPGDAPQSL